jgi:hypothetical protein
VFACLSVAERNEQLIALNLAPDAVPAPRYPGFLTMGDDVLIDNVSAAAAGEPLPLGDGESRDEVVAEASAELARRLNTWEPTRAGRAQLEDADEPVDPSPVEMHWSGSGPPPPLRGEEPPKVARCNERGRGRGSVPVRLPVGPGVRDRPGGRMTRPQGVVCFPTF